MIDLWTKTSGTWINIFTVAIGTTLGLTLKNRLSKKMQLIITQGIGLITIWLGLSMANTMSQVKAGNLAGVILGLLAMVIGGIIGEILEIEEKLTGIGNYLKQKFRGQGRFTEGFVASSLLFCVSPMTLIGCLNNGLTGDNTLLTIKATMDGIVSIVLANIYGIGVGCSILVLLIYQGGLSLAAGAIAVNLPNPESSPYILLATGVGGLIIVGIGLNLLDITKIRVASFLPAIALAPLVYYMAN
jgi:uncharacterized protein